MFGFHSSYRLIATFALLCMALLAASVTAQNRSQPAAVDNAQSAKKAEAAATARDPNAAKPELFLFEDFHDFGEVDAGATLEHTFVLINAGHAPLRIEGVHKSCGCTVTRLDKNILDPNDFAELDVTFHPGTFSGRQNKTITIVSNDPNRPRATLRLLAQVKGGTSPSIAAHSTPHSTPSGVSPATRYIGGPVRVVPRRLPKGASAPKVILPTPAREDKKPDEPPVAASESKEPSFREP